ncbi:MAG: response regulator [Chitinophagaceae bacterium]
MRRLFIIDDNEELVDILKHLLAKEYIIKTRLDTMNIIADIMDFKPDLLIIDHSVGDVSSADIIRELKASIPGFNVPVILFSAHGSLKEIALATGAAGYIEKPSDINYIRSYIRNIAEKKNSM